MARARARDEFFESALLMESAGAVAKHKSLDGFLKEAQELNLLCENETRHHPASGL